jgi:putative PIN family toxin of toxin-antitoxin system
LNLSSRIAILELLKEDAIFIEPTEIITDCRDPKDNKFLELAVAANADYIITGDLDLLILNPFRTITILKSGEFINLEIA